MIVCGFVDKASGLRRRFLRVALSYEDLLGLGTTFGVWRGSVCYVSPLPLQLEVLERNITS